MTQPNFFPDDSLPPLLMTSDPDSFARNTIVERKPWIIGQVMADNDYAPDVLAALEDFRDEIAHRPVRPLPDEASDAALWNTEWAAYPGRTWLEVPWYLAESYFYRRLLEAVGYFQPGSWQGRDPFRRRKQLQEAEAIAQMVACWDGLAGVAPEVAFEALVYSSLWGNRADLSNHVVRVRAQGGLAAYQERDLVLIDHTDRARDLLARGVGRVDFVTDNVGMELFFDLALADFLLVRDWARQVVLDVKERPFFVSDAMPADVYTAVALLSDGARPAVRELGERLRVHQEGGRLAVRADPFWTTPFTFRQMPPQLAADLAQSDLVILKGDVNYRRLLGDRHWPYTTRMEAIAGYFPAPFLALRTLKGEIMVGLAAGQAEALAAQDPGWLINGKRGVVQFGE